MAQEVFISYRSEDKLSAERVCESLERSNIKCWIAPRDIAAGQEWATAIVTALGQCSHFVLILSSHSQAAKQISREAELADKQGLPIITFRVEDVEPPPGLVYFLGNIQWLDAFGDRFEPAIARLQDVVRNNDGPAQRVTGPATVAPAIAPPSPARVETHSTSVERAPSPRFLFVLVPVVVIGLALAGWYFSRSPALHPDPPHPDASAFGIEYMRTRDSGELDRAYSMLGPLFRSSLDRQRFGSEAEALQANGKVIGYAPTGPCTVRERGAYACDYRVSYSGGRTRNERLVVADHNGTLSIAADRFGAAQ